MTREEKNELLKLRKGRITVVLGSETGTNITASLELGEAVGKEMRMGNVLYLNTVQTGRALADSIREFADFNFGKGRKDYRIAYETCMSGLITSRRVDLEKLITGRGIKYVIINSWEFASKDYRRKDELIFMLQEWAHNFGVTIIVFAESVKISPVPGKIQRGPGIGKLAACAAEIKSLVVPKDESEDAPELVEVEAGEYAGIATDDLSFAQRYSIIHEYLDEHPEYSLPKTGGLPWQLQFAIVNLALGRSDEVPEEITIDESQSIGHVVVSSSGELVTRVIANIEPEIDKSQYAADQPPEPSGNVSEDATKLKPQPENREEKTRARELLI